jgi:hypothetical protein
MQAGVPASGRPGQPSRSGQSAEMPGERISGRGAENSGTWPGQIRREARPARPQRKGRGKGPRARRQA